VTARRAKRENGGLGEDPPGNTITYLQVLRTWMFSQGSDGALPVNITDRGSFCEMCGADSCFIIQFSLGSLVQLSYFLPVYDFGFS
jgi:hypothetical protein